MSLPPRVSRVRSALASGALILTACGANTATVQAPARRDTVVLSLVATSDLHGHVEALPVLGGYLAVVRHEREHDGAVILLDGGDLFQGTLESNLGEGDVVIQAYNALGYTAAAVGNHEFDFGPVGPSPLPRAPTDDPQGALRARAHEARFPFLLANASPRDGAAWDNVRPSVIREFAGVRVGLVGVTSEDTPRTTAAGNVANLVFSSPTEAIAREAASLRAQGATVVIAIAHAGGRCTRFDAPEDLSSCDDTQEIFHIARTLPAGAVDAIVAGHTHAAVAHRVAGIPVVQSYAQGRAFGRVDLTVNAHSGRVISTRIDPPRDLCNAPPAHGPCEPGTYDGQPVAVDAAVRHLLEPAFARARTLREQPLGVDVRPAIHRAWERESALGNVLADLLRAGRPGADVAVLNAGGIRADLAEGPLTYGALFEVLPFDNKVATVRMTAAGVASLIAQSLSNTAGVVSISGVRATARCDAGTLRVTLLRSSGEPIPDATMLTVVTSDFLATGGEGFFSDVPRSDITVDDAHSLRDTVVDVLRARGGVLRGDDPAILTPRRLDYPGNRPVRCVQ